MVLLTVTSDVKAATEEYCRLKQDTNDEEVHDGGVNLEELSKTELGSPMDHNDLIAISRFLVRRSGEQDENWVAKEWRLDALVQGANVYQPPPPPKPEPVCSRKS